jgi:hypothetical protein
MIVQNVAPFAGMTQTGSTGVISAATGAAPLAVIDQGWGFSRVFTSIKKCRIGGIALQRAVSG